MEKKEITDDMPPTQQGAPLFVHGVRVMAPFLFMHI